MIARVGIRLLIGVISGAIILGIGQWLHPTGIDLLFSGQPLAAITVVNASDEQTPFNGTPAPIPGTIQAEDFDNGGQGLAYQDADVGNNGGAYRPAEDVDLESSTDTGGGFNLGWAGAGEWLEYTVNVQSAGTYTLESRVASNGNGGSFHVEFNGVDKTGAIVIPNTGGWQSWQSLTTTGVSLSAGQQVMRLAMDTVGATGAVGNFNYVKLTAAGTPVSVTCNASTNKTLGFGQAVANTYAGSGFNCFMPGSIQPDGSGLTLDTAGGQLTVATTNGDAYSMVNTQNNALALKFNNGTNYSVRARIKGPFITTSQYQAGGIFLGLDTDNYVKLVLGQVGGSARLEFAQETGATFASAGPDTGYNFTDIDSNTEGLDLWLVRKSDGTVEALYRTITNLTTTPVFGPIVSAGTTSGAPAWVLSSTQLYGGLLTTDLGPGDSINVNFDEFQLSTVPKPNIVVIMTDDLDAGGTMDVMNTVRMKLKNKGVTFINSYVEFSTCCPSRATFLTGQNARNHHVLSSDPVSLGGYIRLDGKDNTLPVWLKAAGYHTAHIGKYLNGYGTDVDPCPIPPGWDTWRGLRDPETYRYYGYKVVREGCTPGATLSPDQYQTDYLADEAVSFITSRASSSQPFFLSWAPLAPHQGDERTSNGTLLTTPAPRHKGMLPGALPLPGSYDEADVSDKPGFVRDQPQLSDADKADIQMLYQSRRESLLAVDEAIDRIIKALDATGKLSNTYIVFTSDNGFFQGEHRRPEQKLWVYENSIKVPLIIRGPGVPAGKTRRQYVLNTDVAATILQWAGAVPGRTQDGRSLRPVLTSATAPWRSAFLVEGLHDTYRMPAIRFKAIHTDQFVYVEHTTGETELYDLVRDPNQLESRHDDPAYEPIRTRLKARLASLKTCAGASCWVTETFTNTAPSTRRSRSGEVRADLRQPE
jgi:arylsulfatase A-like enzyme